MKANEKLRTYALSEIAHTKVHGRTTGRLDPLTLFWTGSGVEWNVKTSELWIEVEADYDDCEPWISVLVNGAWVGRQMVAAGRQWLCVFRSMNGAAVKNVRVVKDTQAMSGDPGCLLQIRSVRCDGEFLPVAGKPRKIEFVGDSITSGEGAIGATCEQDWIPMWFSAIDNYAAMTAEALDAEYRILSQSGWGVVTGWDNNPHSSLPAYYEQVCGLLTGERNRELGALEANDFAAWQPDVVVVNLGTNDDGAFHYQEWRDPQTGETYEQRMNADGTMHADDLAVFEGGGGAVCGQAAAVQSGRAYRMGVRHARHGDAARDRAGGGRVPGAVGRREGEGHCAARDDGRYSRRAQSSREEGACAGGFGAGRGDPATA
ncbi:GDSL family lipase [Cohnella ginsengisoli]|uniref:GDSL family lipase n=1 Tax=Cohnella ginsengisoli TaxID=425004 RepID=A0A9X4QQA2_9BACL|nr:GDSL family lipase [Cohnella ginsengisoli]MDG0795184.1 GDSL family lipase [Cohnella ginsengisoli]